MKTTNAAATNPINNGDGALTNKTEKKARPRQRFLSRRAFLGRSLAAGAGTIGVGLLGGTGTVEAIRGGLTPGDAALLRFPAALELLEADFWIQYNELAGIQDPEVPGGTGNPDYTAALAVLDEDMDQYIHDNTDDEITHHTFLNAYLVSKGAAPADLDPFRTLMGSTATGVNPALIGHRLTNLTQLTVDTSWWTRYRDDSHNPDLDPDHVFPQAVPTLGVNQHTAIPRTDADTMDPNFLQAIANTAGFHFPTIEQGGNSLYPSLAQKDRRRCDGCSHVSNEHGTFHRPIASVFCVYDRTGASSRPHSPRSWLSSVTAKSTREQKSASGRTKCGRSPLIGAASGCGKATIFLFHKNAFQGTILAR